MIFQKIKNKALIYQINTDHRKTAKYLIKKGADINATDTDGNTPLLMLLQNPSPKKLEFAKYLIEKGADINATDTYGDTPLLMLLRNPRPEELEFAKYLIEQRGADINAMNQDGDTPLLKVLKWYSKPEELEFAKYLIEQRGADINATNQNGDTPLLKVLKWCSKPEALEFAKYLIEQRGADINATNQNGDTLLFKILKWPSKPEVLKFAQYLIEQRGADINATNQNGDTPLLIAAQFGYNNLVEEMVKTGADLSVINRNGNDIITYYQDDAQMLEWLMLHGLEYRVSHAIDDELRALVDGIQSSHNVDVISKIYSHFMDDDTSTQLQQKNSEKYISVLQEELYNIIINDRNLEFRNLFLKLVQQKLRDCIANIGQGDDFVKTLLSNSKSKVSILEIKSNQFDFNQLTKQFEVFIDSKDSKQYFDTLVKKALDIAKQLQSSKSIQINNNTIKPDLIIPLIQKIANEKKAIYQDIMNNLSIELIDAATMYSSGGRSCIKGTLNKLATILIDQIEDNQNQVTTFSFAGFLVNFNELLETALKFDKDNKIKPDQELSSLDAQKIRGFIYQVIKTDSIADKEFAKIVYYGETENVFVQRNHIEQFRNELTYEMLYEIQKKSLVKNINLTYGIPKEYLPDYNIAEILQNHNINDGIIFQTIITKLYDLSDDSTDRSYDELIEQIKLNRNQLNLAAAKQLEGEELVSFLGETLAQHSSE